MPAHKREIPKPECEACRKPARYEVFNTYNASYGYFCARHAAKKVQDLNKGVKIDA